MQILVARVRKGQDRRGGVTTNASGTRRVEDEAPY